ncbi:MULTISPECIES: hypothetical protein [Exiguobacterium]|uniref:hypothetical protein n=1 Tax=Exiguobacterium TaxID=33986 RepID=UPI000493CA26|nr:MULTISPECIES: hypothetical protein [Exiguobacterium]
MAKIIPLRKVDSVHNLLHELLKMADNGELDNVIIAFNHKNGEVHTGWHNLDYSQRQTLISHQQMDVVKTMIDENY